MGFVSKNFEDFILKRTERASLKWDISWGIQKSYHIDEEWKNVWGRGSCKKGEMEIFKGKCLSKKFNSYNKCLICRI